MNIILEAIIAIGQVVISLIEITTHYVKIFCSLVNQYLHEKILNFKTSVSSKKNHTEIALENLGTYKTRSSFKNKVLDVVKLLSILLWRYSTSSVNNIYHQLLHYRNHSRNIGDTSKTIKVVIEYSSQLIFLTLILFKKIFFLTVKVFSLTFVTSFRYFYLGFFLSLLFIFLFQSYFFIKDLPSPKNIGKTNFPLSSHIYDRNDRLLYEIYSNENRTAITLSEIPIYIAQATIAIEDKDFFKHAGVSPVSGVLRALKDTYQTQELQGGSTITQQLVKSSLLTPERTIQRKMKEIILAIWAERIYSKEEIFVHTYFLILDLFFDGRVRDLCKVSILMEL